jgi:hypothetical protein
VSKFDLEKRAVELFSEWSNTGWSKGQAIQLAREAVAAARAEFDHGLAALLQFNLEAAKRKAADERAEEIARLMELACLGCLSCQADRADAARIARSTIGSAPEKPEPAPGEWVDGPPPHGGIWWALWMDETVPEIVQEESPTGWATSGWRHWSVPITPPPVSPPPAPKSPETREQRLERALRQILDETAATWIQDVAREALEGKP